jgi:hypothetical protein
MQPVYSPPQRRELSRCLGCPVCPSGLWFFIRHETIASPQRCHPERRSPRRPQSKAPRLFFARIVAIQPHRIKKSRSKQGTTSKPVLSLPRGAGGGTAESMRSPLRRTPEGLLAGGRNSCGHFPRSWQSPENKGWREGCSWFAGGRESSIPSPAMVTARRSPCRF